MEDFGGHSFHSRPVGLRLHRRWTRRAPHQPVGQVRRPLRHRRQRHPDRAAAGRGGPARLPVPAHAVGHRRAGQPAHRARLRRRTSGPAGSGPAWTTSRRSSWAGRSTVDLVDDGWTHDYAGARNAPRAEGMTVAEYLAVAEEVDFRIMEAHRHRVEELVADPATAEVVKPYYRYMCKRPCFHDEYLPVPQPSQRHRRRLPRGDRADHRAGPGRRRPPVRGRLHRLRHRVRGRGHPDLPACRTRRRRTRRRHPGPEVG